MSYTPSQIFLDDYPPEAAAWCNESGSHHIEEIESLDGHRRFQIVENPQPTAEELAEQERQMREAEAEAQRIPDLEDATIDLAAYVAELESRIAELEAKNG